MQDRLRKSAAKEGLSLSAFLRSRLGGPFRGLEGISTQEIVDIIREQQGPLE